jgi:cytochrome c-type biogenesis protein CcmH
MFIVLLAALVMAPLAWAARATQVRGRRDAALALHRAQLTELDRDLADRRILASEHDAAKLEVQRRLLSDATLTEPQGERSGWRSLVALGVGVPAAALGLYLLGGHPGLPAMPLAGRILAERAQEARDDKAITDLRARLAQLDPHAERTRQGYVILGQAEMGRGNAAAAADAWGHALTIRFDAELAAETAEAMADAAGRMTPQAAAMFRQALAAAPADAPWKPMVEKLLASGGGP